MPISRQLRELMCTYATWLDASLLAKLVGHGLSAMVIADDKVPQDNAFMLLAHAAENPCVSTLWQCARFW